MPAPAHAALSTLRRRNGTDHRPPRESDADPQLATATAGLDLDLDLDLDHTTPAVVVVVVVVVPSVDHARASRTQLVGGLALDRRPHPSRRRPTSRTPAAHDNGSGSGSGSVAAAVTAVAEGLRMRRMTGRKPCRQRRHATRPLAAAAVAVVALHSCHHASSAGLTTCASSRPRPTTGRPHPLLELPRHGVRVVVVVVAVVVVVVVVASMRRLQSRQRCHPNSWQACVGWCWRRIDRGR